MEQLSNRHSKSINSRKQLNKRINITVIILIIMGLVGCGYRAGYLREVDNDYLEVGVKELSKGDIEKRAETLKQYKETSNLIYIADKFKEFEVYREGDRLFIINNSGMDRRLVIQRVKGYDSLYNIPLGEYEIQIDYKGEDKVYLRYSFEKVEIRREAEDDISVQM